jgi:DNA-binding LacI/PurR family transcriptional regulator
VVELLTQGVDALCVIAPRASSLDILRQQTTGLPTVVIKAERDEAWHTVGVDQRSGAYQAVSYLLDLGHTSIAHLAGPEDWFDARERIQGWRDALTERGLKPAMLLSGNWTSDLGYEIGRTFDFGDATAVFAANDQMALGLVHGLSERGISVPGDMSVVGFDDLPDTRHFLPPLTTVRQDFADLGELALRQIIAAIEGETETHHDMIEPLLIVRASASAPSRATVEESAPAVG